MPTVRSTMPTVRSTMPTVRMQKKSYGQHFLKDDSLLRQIVDAAQIGKDDVVVEIGPGSGALTRHLPQEHLFLIEADRDLIADLREQFLHSTIIHADAVSVDYAELVGDRPWMLIGNLPYNAANAIIMNALQSARPPSRLVVMVQKEVADRMMAKPGADRSVLSVAVQLYGTPMRVMDVKPGSFVPPPKVMSTLIRLDVAPLVDQPERIIRLAAVGFSSRRKQLHKNIVAAGITSSDKGKEALKTIGVREDARAQDLSVDDWIRLSGILSRNPLS